MTLNNKDDIGRTGEDIACRYLAQKGHEILERNYRKRLGEIDVVSKLSGTIYFSEVKTFARLKTDPEPNMRPEDNVTPWKVKKLSRAIQTYLAERFPDKEEPWEFLVISITLFTDVKIAKVKVIADAISG